jgi:hypothetical protein
MMTTQDDAYRQLAQSQEIRKFRLDPVLYRPVARHHVLRAGAVWAVFGGGWCALGLLYTGHGVVTFVPPLVLLAVPFLALLSLDRSVATAIANYELVLSARVLRRASQTSAGAEVLRPEVTRIVETPRGLWVLSERPRRTVFVTRAIDGYADVRETLMTWGAIDSLTGLAAWRFQRRNAGYEALRDGRAGTVLATDATLVEELTRVREASRDRAVGFATPAKATNPKKTLLLWVVLVVMFLAIWQFLSPAKPATPAPHPQRLKDIQLQQ